MITRLFYILFISIFNLNTSANPAPLDFELNKASIADVERVYQITKKRGIIGMDIIIMLMLERSN